MNARSVICFILLACLFVFSTLSPANAEETQNLPVRKAFFESGFIGGFGSGKIPEGNYETVLLIWHLGLDLKKYFPALERHRGSLSVFLETQFNPVVQPETNFEFGISPGLQYRYPLTEKLAAYLLLCTGPHYISQVTEQQANGFLFSNTVGAGIYYFLSEKSALSLGWRWRHLSNADLATPNDGIDANFVTFGYAVFF